MRFVYRPAVVPEIVASPQFQAHLTSTAKAVADGAADIDPFPGRRSTGAGVEVSTISGGAGRRVANQGSFGHLSEFGSVNNPPKAPLRRAAQAQGLGLK